MATGAESARNIHNGPGCGPSNFSCWPRKRGSGPHNLIQPKKPSLEDLRSELLRRDPSAKCKTMGLQELASRLLKLPQTALASADEDDVVS